MSTTKCHLHHNQSLLLVWQIQMILFIYLLNLQQCRIILYMISNDIPAQLSCCSHVSSIVSRLHSMTLPFQSWHSSKTSFPLLSNISDTRIYPLFLFNSSINTKPVWNISSTHTYVQKNEILHQK